ncbi:MAG: ferritin family protein [Candidatus Brocadiae bacterium]|nr:ferritin family protein [Candidatus Brocadiia bacterium]
MKLEQIEQLFSIAVRRETEAYEFYTSAAKKVKDTNVKSIFEKLAKEEMGHYELLEKFRIDPTLLMKISAPSSDWKIAETQELAKLSIEMKPVDAIALAMKKEQQAVEFYRALSSASADASTKKMFDNLANMELTHKHQLENMFVNIGYPEVF